ncbi:MULTISPECIES: hypothetical protein [Hungatella]|uniref:Uncharacterized protein n=1 Tax=Hungatella hathewayi TaxID=154046 RepID=A0A3E4U8I4_9FIRM|nr:hypothetical protein [Hungatella hathewayi]RGD72669.1 hypothetical protein DWX31_00320 [Hungatella hathewayi]RGM03848.1 hypothetical protein DXC39_14165 [Hungatella hathewayi]RGO70646.1 hypothetical protein DXB08_18195 [Hungatella hathewayi]RHM75856.1 hypothetical protein DWZ48_18095 [Hungatella hathewayi]
MPGLSIWGMIVFSLLYIGSQAAPVMLFTSFLNH